MKFLSLRLPLLAALLLMVATPRLSAQAPAGYTLLFEDNFDGNHVNEQDWSYRVDHRKVGSWVDGWDRRDNVSEHDGALHIIVKKERIDGQDEFTGGGLISKHQFGYGYYECLSRPFMAGKGVHSAFWQANGVVENNNILEIDSYEIDSGTNMGTNNLYLHLSMPDGSEPSWPLRSSEPWSFRDDGWYLDAYEYTPDGINFYDNGKLAAHVDYRDLSAAQSVWLTALNGISKTDESKQPGESIFKYFRYYAKDYPGINILPNGDFEYNQQSGPAVRPIAWQLQGNQVAAHVATGDAVHGKYFLHLGDDAKPYDTAVTQSLEYIMNGDYLLTAMVRRTGKGSVSQIRVSGFGGKDLLLDVPASAAWRQIRIPHIAVSNHKVTVAVASKGEAKQWLEVDNIQLMKPPLAGHMPRDPEPFTFHRDPIWLVGQAVPIKYIGDDSFIMFDHHVGQGNAISVTFEINPDHKENATLIARASNSGPSGWAFSLTEDGGIIFSIGSKATHEDLEAIGAYEAGKYQRITGVFDHGEATLYVNGQMVAKRKGIVTNTNDDATAGKLGNTGDDYSAVGDITLRTAAGETSHPHSQRFAGTVADLRIYNRALSSQEISTMKNGPKGKGSE